MYSPKDYKELFNLRHAQLRNVIEHIFGVVKRRFRLMVAGPEYSRGVQAKIPAALAFLHNFIRHHDPFDEAEENSDRDSIKPPEQQDINPEELGKYVTQAERNRASAKRDEIAKAMWADYEKEVQCSSNSNDSE